MNCCHVDLEPFKGKNDQSLELTNIGYTVSISPKPGHRSSEKLEKGNSIYQVELCSLMSLPEVEQYGCREGTGVSKLGHGGDWLEKDP